MSTMSVIPATVEATVAQVGQHGDTFYTPSALRQLADLLSRERKVVLAGADGTPAGLLVREPHGDGRGHPRRR